MHLETKFFYTKCSAGFFQGFSLIFLPYHIVHTILKLSHIGLYALICVGFAILSGLFEIWRKRKSTKKVLRQLDQLTLEKTALLEEKRFWQSRQPTKVTSTHTLTPNTPTRTKKLTRLKQYSHFFIAFGKQGGAGISLSWATLTLLGIHSISVGQLYIPILAILFALSYGFVQTLLNVSLDQKIFQTKQNLQQDKQQIQHEIEHTKLHIYQHLHQSSAINVKYSKLRRIEGLNLTLTDEKQHLTIKRHYCYAANESQRLAM